MKPSLQTFYRSLESDTLLEQADALGQLLQHPGWAVLTKALDVSEEKLVEQLVVGEVKEHAQYAKRTGEINGLKIARELPDVIRGIAEQVRDSLKAGGAGEEE